MTQFNNVKCNFDSWYTQSRGTSVMTLQQKSNVNVEAWEYDPNRLFGFGAQFSTAVVKVSLGSDYIREHINDGGIHVHITRDTALNGGAAGFYGRTEVGVDIIWKYNVIAPGTLEMATDFAGVLSGVDFGFGVMSLNGLPKYRPAADGAGGFMSGNGFTKTWNAIWTFAETDA